jgi:hypothetical protein
MGISRPKREKPTEGCKGLLNEESHNLLAYSSASIITAKKGEHD